MERGLELTGPITAEQRAAVEALLAQRELAPRQRERLEMVKAAWLGEDVAAIARWSRAHAAHGAPLAAGFREDGVAALAGAPIPGRPPKADAAYLAALEQAVDDAAAHAGLAVRRLDLGAAERLSDASRPACASPRAGCGCCCTGSASPAAGPNTRLAHLQDPEEVAACEEALRAAGEKGGGAAGAVRIAL